MHNLALSIVLAEQVRRQCPCGAVADRPFGLCRKCQNRNAWRRKTTANRGKPTRRRIARRFHEIVRLAVATVTPRQLVSNGLEG